MGSGLNPWLVGVTIISTNVIRYKLADNSDREQQREHEKREREQQHEHEERQRDHEKRQREHEERQNKQKQQHEMQSLQCKSASEAKLIKTEEDLYKYCSNQ